jgi:cytochrome c1
MAGALGGAARVIRQRLAAPAPTVVDVELAENGVADASRRAVMAGLGGALLAPAPAFAQKSKMIPKATKEAREKALAYKFSKPSEESDAFKANERRRTDIAAGLTPRDANTTPIRDPVSGDIIANRRTYSEAVGAGADICKNPSSGFRPRGCN